ncbi:helix-turn-helix transcriptional regulator [Sphaerisporangium sp. TRM90804]|uniref:helix-turn-helix domain-containing protein n=1 Tax=Sphaerisporangium sp. TRM90804 TaxID=3031113 RepID=UPI00244A144B|nr:helix-turn-helix transcriptional regulator [Sphaerisporangium sp. TRM90804]MDH2424013.1 helix-turn-helix transcriptional regulator [Sphaerisporangium sp. TRM90804]
MITARAEGDQPPPLNMMARERGSSTVLRILLGSQLRRLREKRGITLEVAGHSIRASHSKISRMEHGRVGFRVRDVADLLTLYGVTDEVERDSMLSLVAQANRPGWWHNYDDVLPNWFEAYVGLEEAATRIRSYEVQFIPGLLQTAEYARAVVLLGHVDGPEAEIQRRVDLRMARQKLLAQPDPPHLWAVIDEAALRRPLGGREVMRGQIAHLIEAVASANVTVQVMPFSAGGHAAAGGPFSILRFAEQDLPDVVYLEQLTSAIYLDKRDDLDRYQAVMERLCLDAVPVSDTKSALEKILKEI